MDDQRSQGSLHVHNLERNVRTPLRDRETRKIDERSQGKI